jgi:hypothetical protein
MLGVAAACNGVLGIPDAHLTRVGDASADDGGTALPPEDAGGVFDVWPGEDDAHDANGGENADARDEPPGTGDAAQADVGVTCTANQKPCGATCSSLSDPATGCASATCDPCDFPHSTPICVGGACAGGACELGFADCDGVNTTGCETDTRTDTQNCGQCAAKCNDNWTCGAGVCRCTVDDDCNISNSDNGSCDEGVCSCGNDRCSPGAGCSDDSCEF